MACALLCKNRMKNKSLFDSVIKSDRNDLVKSNDSSNPVTFWIMAADQAGDEVFELSDALLDGRLQRHHPRLLRATHQGVQITNGLNSLETDIMLANDCTTRKLLVSCFQVSSRILIWLSCFADTNMSLTQIRTRRECLSCSSIILPNVCHPALFP